MPTFRSGSEKLAITLGDAAGIGPQVLIKALARWSKAKRKNILVLGNADHLQSLANELKIPLVFQSIQKLSEWARCQNKIACYFPDDFPKHFHVGKSNPALTRIAVSSIELAVSLAMRQVVDAVVTAPINKAALKEAHFDIPGHTEYLAELSHTKRFDMMLVGGPLRVSLVTRHLAIRDVSSKLTKARVKETILLTDEELKKSFGIQKPRLVVCGLNPHAGERGRFGDEEIKIITPAVMEAKKKTKSLIVGPLSPDALFVDAYQGKYDAVICMYHDQGLIPLKMISRGHGVNVTLGLPFVRTSPDHGTGYDIAHQKNADAGSMFEAMKLATHLAKNRKKNA